MGTPIGIFRHSTARWDCETFPHDVDGIGEVIPWIDVFNQIAGDVAAMVESGEETIWIKLTPLTRKKRRNAYTEFKFGHHKHDHVERIETFKSRLECHDSAFLGSSRPVSPEHMAAVMSKYRRWGTTWLSWKVKAIEIDEVRIGPPEASLRIPLSP